MSAAEGAKYHQC